MVGATFKGMCYMDGMCFAMLTPMLYISVCRKHMLIPWVSEVIYYCDYFEFGNICMFLTLFYAHFCILCARLVG